jgi:hypothetical protein
MVMPPMTGYPSMTTSGRLSRRRAPRRATARSVIATFAPTTNPPGACRLVRRRHAAAGPVDESLARDLSWSFTDAIYQLERGENFGPELVEISEAEANVLMERFKQRWEGAS